MNIEIVSGGVVTYYKFLKPSGLSCDVSDTPFERDDGIGSEREAPLTRGDLQILALGHKSYDRRDVMVSEWQDDADKTREDEDVVLRKGMRVAADRATR